VQLHPQGVKAKKFLMPLPKENSIAQGNVLIRTPLAEPHRKPAVPHPSQGVREELLLSDDLSVPELPLFPRHR